MQKIRVHIKYLNKMTVFDLEKTFRLLNEAFDLFYQKEEIPLSETHKNSPEVTSVSDGSVIVDIVVPISCALLPIIYDIIKNKFFNEKQYIVAVSPSRTSWSDKDNYELSKAVLVEYAVKKSKKSVNDFAESVSLPNIYPKKSVRAKIQNTKQLMIEEKIGNTLSVSPLKNYSSAHRIQFEKARKDLGI